MNHNPGGHADAQSERRRVWLEAIAAATDKLHGAARSEEVIDEIAHGARAVAGGGLAAVIRVQDGVPSAIAGSGPDQADLPALVDAAAVEIAEVLDRQELQFVRCGATVAVLAPLRALLGEQGLVLATLPAEQPLAPPSAWPRPVAVEEETADLIGAFVDQASLVIDRTQALADRHELMLVAERDRIARDLHDVVIQRLFATGLQLQSVQKRIADQETAERLRTVVADLNNTIRDIRSTIFSLQHTHEISLRADVHALVMEYVPVLGFTPLVRTTGPVDTLVPDDIAGQLLAVLREGLSNVARHARACTCMVEVDVLAGRVVLRVIDDGHGFGGDVVESGLRNARRRAVDLGGILTHSNEKPQGTRLEWDVPLPG